MRGTHEIRVSNRRRVSFRLVVRRNITVIRGDSGTGKTTLFDMVAAHMRGDVGNAVSISCDKRCVALTDLDWSHQLAGFNDSIVFVDEGAPYVTSEEFASAVVGSDNYYVIITRIPLHQLPYSVNEIYRIKGSGKYHTLEPEFRPGRSMAYGANGRSRAPFTWLLVEDSKSGYRFFEARFADGEVRCASSGGRSGIYPWLCEHLGQKVFVVADGAAFGPESSRVLALQEQHPQDIRICLPESFEWLLMKAGILHDAHMQEVLEDPSAFIESRDYASWERFFLDLLRQVTRGTALAYDKSRLPEVWVVPSNADRVMDLIANANVR